jgi:ribosome-binding protein aMBF1 (putative translation factor)
VTSTLFVDIAGNDFYILNMITPEQSRAARGWLDWSQATLAGKASVSLSTIRDFEKGRRIPIGNNLAAIENAIRAAGIDLVHDAAGHPSGIMLER